MATSLLRRHLVDKLLEQHCHNWESSFYQSKSLCRNIKIISVISITEITVISKNFKIVDLCLMLNCIHANISHLVENLSTNRQQVVFTLLVPSRLKWNNLLTTCNNLVDIIRLVARLFQQARYSHLLVSSCCNKSRTSCYHLVTSLMALCYNL